MENNAMPCHAKFTACPEENKLKNQIHHMIAAASSVFATAFLSLSLFSSAIPTVAIAIEDNIADNTQITEQTEDVSADFDTVLSKTAKTLGETVDTANKTRLLSGIDIEGAEMWDIEKIEFVSEWAPRIDEYLSGRALCGYGANFAAAAYDYDVDPRVGPAISMIESRGGDVCFRGCNAWGWGGASWASWEDAIDGWTESFASGYGHDMDTSDCARYCPGNGGYYSTLIGQMDKM